MNREAHRAWPEGITGTEGVALAYVPPTGTPAEDRVWIPIGGSHRVGGLSDAGRSKLLAAVLDVKPEIGAKLVLFGADVDGLRFAERTALRARIAFLPTGGGLLSSLNAWENIVLPLGIHHPKHLRGVATDIYSLLAGFRVDPPALLAKLPEKMSFYEKKLTGYVRMLLENPGLVLIENLDSGLDAAERASAEKFPAAYHSRCPGGTFVQLESTARA